MKTHENQWPFHWRGSWYERSTIVALQRTSIWKINDHCFCRGPRYESIWKSMSIPSKRVLIWKIDELQRASIWKINDHCLCRGPWYERSMTIAFVKGLDMKAHENQWPFHRRGSWYKQKEIEDHSIEEGFDINLRNVWYLNYICTWMHVMHESPKTFVFSVLLLFFFFQSWRYQNLNMLKCMNLWCKASIEILYIFIFIFLSFYNSYYFYFDSIFNLKT